MPYCEECGIWIKRTGGTLCNKCNNRSNLSTNILTKFLKHNFLCVFNQLWLRNNLNLSRYKLLKQFRENKKQIYSFKIGNDTYYSYGINIRLELMYIRKDLETPKFQFRKFGNEICCFGFQRVISPNNKLDNGYILGGLGKYLRIPFEMI